MGKGQECLRLANRGGLDEREQVPAAIDARGELDLGGGEAEIGRGFADAAGHAMAREELLREKEERLEKEAKRNAELLATVTKMRADQEEERVIASVLSVI